MIPKEIENADVLYWSVSDEPFFVMNVVNEHREIISKIEIRKLAICTYDNKKFYRFSCNENWEVENDSFYDSIEDALKIPSNFINKNVKWNKR